MGAMVETYRLGSGKSNTELWCCYDSLMVIGVGKNEDWIYERHEPSLYKARMQSGRDDWRLSE